MSKHFGNSKILYDSDFEIANEITADPFSEEPHSHMHYNRTNKATSKTNEQAKNSLNKINIEDK